MEHIFGSEFVPFFLDERAKRQWMDLLDTWIDCELTGDYSCREAWRLKM
jgi:hypothetical protein